MALSALALVLLALGLAGCGGKEPCRTVSEVWQNADALDGKQVCVRGQADFDLLPHHPMQVGGCIPATEEAELPRIVGELALLDRDAPDPAHRLTISPSSLQCEGTVCKVVCKPFAPSAQAAWGSAETLEAFEFVGTLWVSARQGQMALVLDDIDLQASQRLLDGEWGPIPTGEFTYAFP